MYFEDFSFLNFGRLRDHLEKSDWVESFLVFNQTPYNGKNHLLEEYNNFFIFGQLWDTLKMHSSILMSRIMLCGERDSVLLVLWGNKLMLNWNSQPNEIELTLYRL